MKKIENDVMTMFAKLTPINKSVVAAEIKRTYQVEQAIKRQYGLDREPPAQAGKSA